MLWTSPCVDEDPLVDTTVEQLAWPLFFASTLCWAFGAAIAMRTAGAGCAVGFVTWILSVIALYFVLAAHCS